MFFIEFSEIFQVEMNVVGIRTRPHLIWTPILVPMSR